METNLTLCPLFKDLSINDINNIFENIHFQTKNYIKDNIIKLSQDECNTLIIIEEGIIRGEMTDVSGKILKVEDIEAPNTIASAFLFGKNNRFPVNVVANTNCKLIYIEKTQFLKMLQVNKTILTNYLNMISNKAQFLSQRLNILSLKDLKSKLAHYLIKQTQNGKIINFILPQNQTKLADFLGVARPSLARSLKELSKEKIIEINNNNIKILNIEKLRNKISS